MSFQGSTENTEAHIPQIHDTRMSHADQSRTIGRKVDGQHCALCVPQLCLLLSLQVPQPDGAILAGAGQQVAVRPKCQPGDFVRVPGQGQQKLPARHVIDPNKAVVAADGKPMPVGADGHRLYATEGLGKDGMGKIGADVTYTPDANFNGSDSFTYTVGDGNADQLLESDYRTILTIGAHRIFLPIVLR